MINFMKERGDMEDKLKVIENYKIDDKEHLKRYFIENFFFTVSELKEILDILEEIFYVEKEKYSDILKRFEIKNNISKKNNANEFLNYLKKIRYPIKNKIEDKIKEKLNKIKDKNIKINYAPTLECEGIKMEINIKNEKDFEKILKKLNNNEKEIIELIRIVNRGE